VLKAELSILNYYITIEHLLIIKVEENIKVKQYQLLQSQKLSPFIKISLFQTRIKRVKKAFIKAVKAIKAE